MLDHLVYATPNLEASVDELEERLGVRAALGGRHPGRGTHNALISLGRDSYLEIIGPDPSQPAPEGGRSFDIDALPQTQLRTWAVKAPGIDGRAQRAP